MRLRPPRSTRTATLFPDTTLVLALMEIKIIAVGNSAGVLLPKELLARLRVGKGDTLYVAETPDGIKLMPHDPHLAAQMDVAERVMRTRRTLLRNLADRSVKACNYRPARKDAPIAAARQAASRANL